jgi:hypothetical protein
MILYEVRLTPAPGPTDPLVRYMTETHIPAILATGCFVGARFARLDGDDAGRFRTTYLAGTRADLDRYLRDHAPALRAEFVRDLGDAIAATREVWEDVRAFGAVIY